MSTTEDMSALLQDGIRYGAIFADPPWPEQGGGRTSWRQPSLLCE